MRIKEHGRLLISPLMASGTSTSVLSRWLAARLDGARQSMNESKVAFNYIFGKVSRIDCLHMIQTKCFRYVVINQSIRTHLYSATRRKRIRGARWQGLGQVFTVSSVKQFRL